MAILHLQSQNSSVLLHPYWQNYGKVSPIYHLTVAICMVIITFGAVIGNGLVLWSFISFRSLRTASNMLIVNLAIADLMMSVIDFPLLIIASFLQDWPFGYAGCQLYGTLTGLAGLVTINSLVVIALDRYQAVVRRLNVTIGSSRTKCLQAIFCTWVYGFLWAIAPVFGWSKYRLEGVRTTCSFDYLSRDSNTIGFIIAISCFEFILPISMIIGAYFQIISTMILRRRDLSIRYENEKVTLRLTRQKYRIKSEIRTAFIIIGLVVLFVVAWLPYTIVAMIGIFGDRSNINPYMTAIVGLVAKTSTVYNPIVYAIIHPKFKTKIGSIFNGQRKDSTSQVNRKNSALSSSFSQKGRLGRRGTLV